MNPGRGWNPNLEETYLQEYTEYEDEISTQGTSGFYIRPVKILAPNTYPIKRYRKYTKTISFSIIGFLRPWVKLGFDFPIVSPNQKSLPRSLNFNFDEERNPMPGSLKNSSSVEIPNFPHWKLKMLGIEFCFDRKMHPSMESQPGIILLMDCGEKPKKLRSLDSATAQCIILRLALIPC